MLEYETSDAMLAAVAARHGVAAGRVRPLPEGVANRAFLLGDDLVLRVPRTERFLPDLLKEAAVIPVALRAGVRTAEVVAFDGGGSEVGVPYMVLTRTRGVDLARLDPRAAGMARVLREVGRELGRLHRVARSAPPTPPGPQTASAAPASPALAGVPVDGGGVDPWALTGRLVKEGWIDEEAGRWLGGWFDRLSAHLPASPPLVLVHGDIAPQNLLVLPETARLGGIVDWGDAAFADPASDFAKMPLECVPAMLGGYREETPADAPDWEARVLWFHLTWALGRLAAPAPRPGERHWTAPPAARLLGLLRFFASAPPAPWAGLT
ncbi:aminoglycoside phosphotransferase (APT) family kinase protein [Nonomuraea thailandensis]|uniref:Aminoglycoside phosphotransferase (APT) family kinase protein n=1 Tax=Nonomuraea thailandensis TaxID=1188745 RepID=A0A9X2GEG5_9ACTN|nr:aminoglycoside phosphotransferase family protein [Nonomuraea thailandensis]MCP2356142.1 aminoglycoside phosphotransferase (APT) family kinase protein [Nonomuraea thailandensis]